MIVLREDARRQTNYYMHDDDETHGYPSRLIIKNAPLRACTQNYR